MHLFPRSSPKGGYFFDLNGSSAGRAPETVITANALLKAGYPVYVSEFNKIKGRIEGTDILEVVPQHLRSISEPEISLPEGDAGLAIAKCVKWNFHEYRLKGKN